jgi:hypothetical protein
MILASSVAPAQRIAIAAADVYPIGTGAAVPSAVRLPKWLRLTFSSPS